MALADPHVVDARALLAGKGISMPVFPLLEPNANSYTLSVLQPKGEISDTPSGVRNANHALAVEKVRRFLISPDTQHADICIAPEYCCPWAVIDCVVDGQIPFPAHAIWILGCEGITIGALRAREAAAPNGVKWIFEPPEPQQQAAQSFLDPVCIVMRALIEATSQAVLVVLVQFKTEAMGGVAYEQEGMIRGASVYAIKNPGDYSIRLITLLCSDVLPHATPRFANLRAYLTDQHRILLIHLQLNPEPRHDVYRPYRELFLQRNESRQLITLNWARNVEVRDVNGNLVAAWANVAMSAVYARRWKKSDLQQQLIDECERRGLYFCYSSSLRSAVAVFNFREYAFTVLLSKVSQEAELPLHQSYVPPAVSGIYKWDGPGASWTPESIPVDAEPNADIDECNLVVGAFGNLFDAPRLFERFAALSVGELRLGDDPLASYWPRIDALDATSLDPTEIVKRTTFAQDTSDIAKQFRRQRYQRLQRFSVIRQSSQFPKRMSPFVPNTVTYEFDLPYSNVRSGDGRPGTAIYLHNAVEADAKVLYTRIQKHLRLLPEGRVDMDHVVIWYLGPMTAAGAALVQFPPDLPPHTTDHPLPNPNSIVDPND